MLANLRYFGIGFNPVTFYYCFDEADTQVESIVAEITNTPWNERHAYVLTQPMAEVRDRVLRYRFAKDFHVSPFMPMEMQYDWRFGVPGRALSVNMQNYRDGERVFDATLDLSRREIGAASLARALVDFPCMTATVLGGIYTQAPGSGSNAFLSMLTRRRSRPMQMTSPHNPEASGPSRAPGLRNPA